MIRYVSVFVFASRSVSKGQGGYIYPIVDFPFLILLSHFSSSLLVFLLLLLGA